MQKRILPSIPKNALEEMFPEFFNQREEVFRVQGGDVEEKIPSDPKS